MVYFLDPEFRDIIKLDPVQIAVFPPDMFRREQCRQPCDHLLRFSGRNPFQIERFNYLGANQSGE